MGLYLNMQGNDKGGSDPGNPCQRELCPRGHATLLHRPQPHVAGRHAGDGFDRQPRADLRPESWSGLCQPCSPAGITTSRTRPMAACPPTGSPSANYTNPMVLVPTHHDLTPSSCWTTSCCRGPAGSQADPSSTNFDSYCSQDLEAGAGLDLQPPERRALHLPPTHPAAGDQQPQPDYLYRVVQAFNDNGAGVRGDLQAVIKAILLDYEARSPDMVSDPNFGKQREPLSARHGAGPRLPGPGRSQHLAGRLHGRRSAPNAAAIAYRVQFLRSRTTSSRGSWLPPA